MKEARLTQADVLGILPPRPRDCHKGTFGTLTVVSGCRSYRGAAALALLGALRAGVGIVRLAAIEPVIASVSAKLYEPIYLPLAADADGVGLDASAVPLLLDAAAHSTALLIGCGCGRTEGVASATRTLLRECKIPLIIDADALFALAENTACLHEAAVTPILTPHFGEMARLTGLPISEIAADPVSHARKFACKNGCVLLLKGADTVIASPTGEISRNSTGNAGLAKGGSGDVLAGIISALSAQGIAPYDAARVGAYLHGAAADLLAPARSLYGMLPSELGDSLAAYLASCGR